MKLNRIPAVLLCACLFCLITAMALVAGANEKPPCDCCPKGRQPVATKAAVGELEEQASCKYCGMDHGKFDHSRMLIEYDDGTSVGTCSIHCLAVELGNTIDKIPTAIRVGDYGSRKLIDAETAYWVIGGEKAGVMSSRAKWAFEKKANAEAFILANRGSLASFEDALKAAYEDLYKDNRMIRDRRKLNRMKQLERK